ncbi:MAG: alpha/beta hydrolase [Hyphomicrobiales bacterium]|nr:alpha/beta hydrolase [Hyphomicrobiales bacterium]
MSARLEPIQGRYLRLTLRDRQHRIYFEEAGSGVPLVCLHTGGADTRQYRHLMGDADITSRFRVIAFDMPFHGKSTPPDGWEQEEYRLTLDDYVETITALCAALELDRPAIMGCSIGGRVLLHLAITHGHAFRAMIAIACAVSTTPWYDTQWLHRSDVHGGEICAGIVSGLMAPSSPAPRRHETLWSYMQSGPGVFKGDLFFYRQSAGLAEGLKTVDASACPLFLMSGDYDFSCTREDMARTAAAISGAELVAMAGVGHFPMSENPDLFKQYLTPVLDRIGQS